MSESYRLFFQVFLCLTQCSHVSTGKPRFRQLDSLSYDLGSWKAGHTVGRKDGFNPVIITGYDHEVISAAHILWHLLVPNSPKPGSSASLPILWETPVILQYIVFLLKLIKIAFCFCNLRAWTNATLSPLSFSHPFHQQTHTLRIYQLLAAMLWIMVWKIIRMRKKYKHLREFN